MKHTHAVCQVCLGSMLTVKQICAIVKADYNLPTLWNKVDICRLHVSTLDAGIYCKQSSPDLRRDCSEEFEN